ncbi:hypothetical protein D3C86_2057640 [compost metagenome]
MPGVVEVLHRIGGQQRNAHIGGDHQQDRFRIPGLLDDPGHGLVRQKILDPDSPAAGFPEGRVHQQQLFILQLFQP